MTVTHETGNRDGAAGLLDDLPTLLAFVTAQDCGLLAQLERGAVGATGTGLPAAQARLLLHLLTEGGVVEAEGADAVRFSSGFAATWAAQRDALLARARFVLMAAGDMINGRQAYFRDPGAFFGQARTFGFFAYGRAGDTKAANLQDTEGWVAYVDALNATEAPGLAPHMPLEGAAQLLEIGGNAGGFALAVLARFPDLHATVLDLPAVCAIGRRQTAGAPGAERLSFVAGDATAGPWPMPGGRSPGAICFKSVLHDWKPEAAAGMIGQAARHVAPGGRVIVVERGPLEDAPGIGGLSLCAELVFASFYRPPDWYVDRMAEAGLHDIRSVSVALDPPFHIVSGERPA